MPYITKTRQAGVAQARQIDGTMPGASTILDLAHRHFADLVKLLTAKPFAVGGKAGIEIRLDRLIQLRLIVFSSKDLISNMAVRCPTPLSSLVSFSLSFFLRH